MPKSQWPQIAAAIQDKIISGELKPGDKIDSEADIAARFGVSRPTAHRALGELQRLGLVRRQRRWGTVVMERPRATTKRVAFLVDGFSPTHDFPQAALLAGLHEGLTDECALTLWDCRGIPEREAELLTRAQSEAGGIVLYPTCHPSNTPLIQRLVDDGFPIVLLDRLPPGLEAPVVATGNEEVTLRSVKMLLERGHRRIGFVGFEKPDVSAVVERYGAYERALRSAGLEPDPRHIRWFPPELEDGRPHLLAQQIHDALFTLLNAANPITALFCVQDVFSAYILQSCETLNVEIPGQLEIVTFNDWPASLLHRPWQAHRIVQRKHEIGLQAAALLRQQMEGLVPDRTTLRVPADLLIADAWARPGEASPPEEPLPQGS
jgi:DNA-binding LacI/PurR family transcriptional regulator